MSFYNPQMAGPDIGGGIQELMSQFMMFKMIQEMYPRLDKGAQGELKKNPMFEQFLHGTGINPGEGTEVGESELPGQSRVGHYVVDEGQIHHGLGNEGFYQYYPWLVSNLLQLYPPQSKFEEEEWDTDR